MARTVGGVKRSIELRSWPVASAAIAVAALVMGYADVWRGGVTLGPLFLTIGYVVLVPVAMVAVPRGR